MLNLIGSSFEIRGVHQVTWTPQRVDENFARFYQGPPVAPYGQYFSEQKGRGPFLVVVAADNNPIYEERTTHRGTEVLNARCYDLKQTLRSVVSGMMRIHSTDSAAEADRDLLLLLGMTGDRYLLDHPEPWNGSIESVHRDLTGADGWADPTQLLEVLNHGLRYIVLRNFEDLPDTHVLGPHDDIDLLTDNYGEMVRLVNAKPLHRRLPKHGGRFLGRIGDPGHRILFDIRHVDDGYYDPAWARRMLDNRRWCNDHFFAPAPEDYLPSLAYHAVFHKTRLSDEYRGRLTAMVAGLPEADWSTDDLADDSAVAARLDRYLAGHGYSIRRPKDPTVHFNRRAAGEPRPGVGDRLDWLRHRWYVRWMRASHGPIVLMTGLKRRLTHLFPGMRLLQPRHRSKVKESVALASASGHGSGEREPARSA